MIWVTERPPNQDQDNVIIWPDIMTWALNAMMKRPTERTLNSIGHIVEFRYKIYTTTI